MIKNCPKNLISIVIVILWSGFPWRGRVLLLSLLVALQKQTRELKVNNYIVFIEKLKNSQKCHRDIDNYSTHVLI